MTGNLLIPGENTTIINAQMDRDKSTVHGVGIDQLGFLARFTGVKQ